jgi:parallel beta-helix repeat protein
MLYAACATAVLAVLLFVTTAEAGIRHFVDPNLLCSSGNVPVYATIQDAMDAAAPGDVIDVCRGSYAEQIQVSTSHLNVMGRPGAHLVGPGPGAPGATGFQVSASNVVISGFEVSGFSEGNSCGIRVKSASLVEIRRNTVSQNWVGICLEGSTATRVRLNEVRANVIDGVQVLGGEDNAVTDNDVSANGTSGIVFLHSNGLTVDRNVADRNVGSGIFGSGNGIQVRHNVTRDNGQAGISIISSLGALVTANRMINNRGVGLAFGFSLGGVLRANKAIANTIEGIRVGQTGSTLVIHNFALENAGNGINVDNSGAGDTYIGNYAARNNPGGAPSLADCKWDGTGAPRFEHNRCATELPPGVWK